uniref:Zein-binding n=1 Tax=Candidatus Kentrum sp. TC TaxID=2126339 RepID=A0A450YPA6_9GAMM|nr:MAG: hypothetical protein BECKTC1821E_GA0114239_102512 [Candidatus Kentron sp. TC]
MKCKVLTLIVFCLVSTPTWSWDFDGSFGEPMIKHIARDEAMVRDARALLLRRQKELRRREKKFVESLTKKIEDLEMQVEKQNEVIATYEKLVVSLKAELDKEKNNGKK